MIGSILQIPEKELVWHMDVPISNNGKEANGDINVITPNHKQHI